MTEQWRCHDRCCHFDSACTPRSRQPCRRGGTRPVWPDTQPDEIVCTEGSITLLERLREAYDGPLNVHGSTTDESFDEVLIRFGARLLPEYYRVALGWITTARRTNALLVGLQANTALNAARTFNTCVEPPAAGGHQRAGTSLQRRPRVDTISLLYDSRHLKSMYNGPKLNHLFVLRPSHDRCGRTSPQSHMLTPRGSQRGGVGACWPQPDGGSIAR
jgi:hypothetical protein